MNIAMIGHKQVPSREGGIEVVVSELAYRMAEKGNSVTCFNRKGGREAENRVPYKIITVPTIQKKGLAAASSSFFSAVRAAAGRYDVVHFHAEGPAFMCRIPKLVGKKVIVTVHGLDHQRAKWGRFASAYIKGGEKNAVKYADHIIVLSRNVQQYFLDTYARETVYIPNGIERPEKKGPDLITKKYGLEKNGYILFVGRLVPEKGLTYLIEAFKKTDTGKKLVIAGGSSDTDIFTGELKKACEDDDRIIFTGFATGRLLEELYSNAYVYVLPSDVEGMPLTLLEAMSYGNCCLTSDIAECTEVTEDKALSFKKGDPADLKEKLQYLIKNEDIVSYYKANASDYICSRYNWDEVTDRTLMLYRN